VYVHVIDWVEPAAQVPPPSGAVRVIVGAEVTVKSAALVSE